MIDFARMGLRELRDHAKRLRVKGYSRMRKEALLGAVLQAEGAQAESLPSSLSVQAFEPPQSPPSVAGGPTEEELRRNREFPFESLGDLPASYGVTRVQLMPRDERWLHCYWEVEQDILRRAGERLVSPSAVLRVFHHSAGSGESFYNVPVSLDERRHYLHVPYADTSYRVALGLIGVDGTFAPLAASNELTTPPDGVAGPTREHFVTIPFDRPVKEHLAELRERGEVRLDSDGRLLTTDEWRRLFGAGEAGGRPSS